MLPEIDAQYLLDFLIALLNIPSPTGFAHQAIAATQQALSANPQLHLSRTHKGALVAFWSGQRSDAPRALTAHVDTLGAMVKEIKANGRLQLTKIGGFAWNKLEGGGRKGFTPKGAGVGGAFFVNKGSRHV